MGAGPGAREPASTSPGTRNDSAVSARPSAWPGVRSGTLASHRSAESGHELVLRELGLEPLLDLRMRLGEATGAMLALPLVQAAGALHREMGTFEESAVERAR